MKKAANIILMWSVLCVYAAQGQRFVVIDMETKLPVRNVVVKCGDGKSTATIWDGSFMLDTLAADNVDSLITLSRSGYMTRSMTHDELTDTLELLPTFNALTEVIIFGKRRTPFSFCLSKDDIIPPPMPKPGTSADIMGALEKLFTYKSRKRLKETKKRMEEY